MNPVIAGSRVNRRRLPLEVFGAEVRLAAGCASMALDVDGLNMLTRSHSRPDLNIWARDDRAVISHREIGDFDVLAGQLVVVHPRPDAEAERVRSMVHGLASTFVLGQQGRFALHASTVAIGTERVAIGGPSGVGKSTTAVRLVQRGATPIVDDVTVLDVSGGLATTASWGRDVHVWPHVADDLQLDVGAAHMTSGPKRKWALRWPAAKSGPVRHIVLLNTAPVDKPILDIPEPLTALRLLGRTTHHQRAMRQVWAEEMFAWQAQVSAAARVASLRRPTEGSSLDEVCDLIERWIADPTA